VAQMSVEPFGGCTNIGECTSACPKEIQQEVIATMNRDYRVANVRKRDDRIKVVEPTAGWSAKG